MINGVHVTLGRLINRAYSEDFIQNGVPPSLASEGYTLADVIVGTDPGGVKIHYGFLARSMIDGSFAIAIRGTDTPGEWLEDFLAVLVSTPFASGSENHAGFFDLYRNLTNGIGIPIGKAFADLGAPVAVTGHSLGGPLATMLAGEIGAALLVGFASPKPGNGKFAAWIRARVSNIELYANVPDVVPHVPFTLPPFEDFLHVDCLTVLDSSEIVSGGLRPAHDLNTYLHLLDPAQPLTS